jgi:Flp pilus assembly protein TadG
MSSLSRWRRFRAEAGGASAVEFALVLPAFVLLVMGSMSAATLGFSFASMNYAVEDAARCAAVKKAACLTPADTAKYARAKYVGVAVSPVFTYSTAGCGNTVTGTATYSLNLIPQLFNVPLSTAACHPSAGVDAPGG